MNDREILKNQFIQKAQQYFTDIASIFGLIGAFAFVQMPAILRNVGA